MNWVVTIGGIAYNIIIIIVCSAFIFWRRKQQANHQEDFLFGGKQMGWFACAASLALTALGGGHVNGLSAQSWATGVATIWYCFGSGVMLMIIGRYCGVWYRRSGCNTTNEMFAKMFHPVFVPILSGFAVGYSILILCVEGQGMAQIISSMTGLSNLAGAIIGMIIGVLYVFIAGVEEVGLVNSVNAILMYVFGFIALFCIGVYCTGGWEGINGTILDNNPELLAALGNPDIIRGYVIGTFLSLAVGMNMIQANNQPVASLDSLKVMRKTGFAAVIMNVLFGAIIISFGLASKGLVDQGYMQAAHGAEGIVVMILTFFPDWLQIAIIGMFLAAMLSTVSMLALTVALLMNRHILCYFPKYKNMDAKTENKLSRIWIILSCAIAAVLAVTIQAQTNTAITWGFAWFIPVFVLFIIGMHWRRSQMASITTLIVAWIFNMLVSYTNIAATFNLEGNNHSIFLCVISIVLGIVLTAVDKKAKPAFIPVYEKQRAAYDAAKASSAAPAN